MNIEDMFSAGKDPKVLHEYEGKWYFWDETWSNRLGPYKAKDEAESALKVYIKEFLGE